MPDKNIPPLVRGWKGYQFVYGKTILSERNDYPTEDPQSECYCHESCGCGSYRYVVNEELLDQQ